MSAPATALRAVFVGGPFFHLVNSETGVMNDADQLKFATANERIMVTFDPDFLALQSSGMQHAGIAWSHMLKYSIGQLIFMLVLLHAVLDREDMKNRVEYLYSWGP